MKYIYLGNKKLKSSAIALGCMRIKNLNLEQAEKLILSAVDMGINFFDHADIYGDGICEKIFGDVLARNPNLREKILIQTKVGICKGYYDSSKEHILAGVNKALKYLQTDYIDILLIHRPDALTDYKELAETFDILHAQNKVRHFGVSNMNRFQMELFSKYIKHDIIANQLQLSVTHALLIDQGIFVNMRPEFAIDRVGGTLEYCALHDITVQPWSVLLASWEDGTFLDNPKYENVNKKLEELAAKYHVTKNAVAVAWLLRHPANLQPIVGTTSPVHLKEMVAACDINLTRQEWYAIYLANNKFLP